MGEIKSTLDIIMEKTKGMTMSDEEKRELKKKELSDRLKGLIQKFLDGILTYEDLKGEISANDEDERELMLNAATGNLFPILIPGENNNQILQLLDIFKEIDVKSIEEILAGSEQKIESEKNIYKHNLERRIKERGISGTAVTPNLNADKEWVHKVESIKKEFQEKLTGISKQL